MKIVLFLLRSLIVLFAITATVVLYQNYIDWRWFEKQAGELAQAKLVGEVRPVKNCRGDCLEAHLQFITRQGQPVILYSEEISRAEQEILNSGQTLTVRYLIDQPKIARIQPPDPQPILGSPVFLLLHFYILFALLWFLLPMILKTWEDIPNHSAKSR